MDASAASLSTNRVGVLLLGRCLKGNYQEPKSTWTAFTSAEVV
jgi:hypothetical protein